MTKDPEKNKILNFDELNTTQKRSHALKIAERGLRAIDSNEVIKKVVALEGEILLISGRPFHLSPNGKLKIVCIGKCAFDAARALEGILGETIADGIVFDIRDDKNHELKKIKCVVGSHPMPTDDNPIATKRVIEVLSGSSENDTVLFVISGGGSALLCLPDEGSKCADEKLIVEELFHAGAPIQDINTIRKHMSFGRGGYLAKYAYPAQVISLIFSDVPGNDINFVASGPTVKDKTTIQDADMILEKYNILRKCNLEHCGLIETPKENHFFEKVYNTIVVSTDLALREMADEAKKLGLHPLIWDAAMNGEARHVGAKIIERMKEAVHGSVHLYGGETTVTVRGKGRGGRNQEVVLSALRFIEDELIMSLASDGKDNGEYAGAIGDAWTKQKVISAGISIEDFLNQNDASTFFERVGDALVKTGNTGSNISDLIIAIK